VRNPGFRGFGVPVFCVAKGLQPLGVASADDPTQYVRRGVTNPVRQQMVGGPDL
jgi:hypothetical protein